MIATLLGRAFAPRLLPLPIDVGLLGGQKVHVTAVTDAACAHFFLEHHGQQHLSNGPKLWVVAVHLGRSTFFFFFSFSSFRGWRHLNIDIVVRRRIGDSVELCTLFPFPQA